MHISIFLFATLSSESCVFCSPPPTCSICSLQSPPFPPPPPPPSPSPPPPPNPSPYTSPPYIYPPPSPPFTCFSTNDCNVQCQNNVLNLQCINNECVMQCQELYTLAYAQCATNSTQTCPSSCNHALKNSYSNNCCTTSNTINWDEIRRLFCQR